MHVLATALNTLTYKELESYIIRSLFDVYGTLCLAFWSCYSTYLLAISCYALASQRTDRITAVCVAL